MRTTNALAKRYGYIFALACVALATALFFPGRDYFAKGQWALLYLLIVGLVAGLSGVKPALVAAALAFLSWNFFFLPPYGTFAIHDPKDWLSLLVFLAVAVAMGMQTGRMREREAEALLREQEMALLNQFSARLVSDTSTSDMADLLMMEVTHITGARCAALYLVGESNELHEFTFRAEGDCRIDPSVPRVATWAFERSKAVGLPQVEKRSDPAAAGWPISVEHAQTGIEGGSGLFIPLQTANRQEGVLHIGPRSSGEPYSLSDVRLLVAAANQTAAFLERKHLQSAAVQADALREADRLKSTLISSVSHELKTPIAAITATVTNLLEQDIDWSPQNLRSELEAVRDDLNRLNISIGALLDLSRLESAAWQPKKDWYGVGDVLGTVISRIPLKQRGRIAFSLPDDLPEIHVDFAQWARVLENLLANALAYSPQECTVRVGASADESSVRMWVEDEGPGIPPDERERVFEKFYRGEASAASSSGTGLGLAVTREIVRFHAGRIWVEDVTPHGARFVVSLPRQEEGDTE